MKSYVVVYFEIKQQYTLTRAGQCGFGYVFSSVAVLLGCGRERCTMQYPGTQSAMTSHQLHFTYASKALFNGSSTWKVEEAVPLSLSVMSATWLTKID
jgi:hypothetical protein